MKNSEIYRKIALNLLFTLIGVLLIIFLLPKMLSFFMPFVIGWVLAMIANPLVRFMERKVKIVRKHGSAIIIVAALALVVMVIYMGGSFLVHQTINLFSDLPKIYTHVEKQMHLAADNLSSIYHVMPEQVKVFLDNLSDNIGSYISSFMSSIKMPTISDAGNIVKNVADGLLMMIITILSAYFFIARKDHIASQVRKIMPKSVVEKYELVVNNFKTAVGGYIAAQFKIMLILIAFMFIGFSLIGVSYALLLAIGVAVLDFLPVFGTGAVLWPWALIDVVTGNYMRALALLVIYLVCQVTKQILQPKMVGDSIGLDPLMTLFFMYVGYKVKGILGMIIGIPIGMVLVNFYRNGFFDNIISNVKLVIKDLSDYMKLR